MMQPYETPNYYQRVLGADRFPSEPFHRLLDTCYTYLDTALHPYNDRELCPEKVAWFCQVPSHTLPQHYQRLDIRYRIVQAATGVTDFRLDRQAFIHLVATDVRREPDRAYNYMSLAVTSLPLHDPLTGRRFPSIPRSAFPPEPDMEEGLRGGGTIPPLSPPSTPAFENRPPAGSPRPSAASLPARSPAQEYAPQHPPYSAPLPVPGAPYGQPAYPSHQSYPGSPPHSNGWQAPPDLSRGGSYQQSYPGSPMPQTPGSPPFSGTGYGFPQQQAPYPNGGYMGGPPPPLPIRNQKELNQPYQPNQPKGKKTWKQVKTFAHKYQKPLGVALALGTGGVISANLGASMFNLAGGLSVPNGGGGGGGFGGGGDFNSQDTSNNNSSDNGAGGAGGMDTYSAPMDTFVPDYAFTDGAVDAAAMDPTQ